MMRPSQSFDVHIGQMSVVVMGSPGVGKNKDNFVKFTYGLLPFAVYRKDKPPAHCFNKLFSQRLHSHPL